MQTITFTCETITPMFLAGADGTTPELRAPSIKGALRFWWRAMNGHLVKEDGDLTALKQRESYVFGGSGKEEGRSKILLRVIPMDVNTSQFRRINMNIKYLAYGSEERKFIDVGSTFKIQIIVNENNKLKSDELIKEIKIAFSLLSFLGGLGSKSRNGFGSFYSNNLLSFDEIKKYISLKENHYLSFTSFSKECQLYLTTKENITSWEEMIEELSTIYKGYGKIDVSKDKRQHIGAPYKDRKPPERHSKIFLMSVFKQHEDDNLQGVITYMPYDYLADYPEMNEIQRTKAKKDWKIATDSFKDGIYNAKKNRNYFVDKQLD